MALPRSRCRPAFFFLIGYVNKLRIRTSLILYGLCLTYTTSLLTQHWCINILLCFIFFSLFINWFPLEKHSILLRAVFFLTIAVLNYFVYPNIEYGLLGLLIMYSARWIALQESQSRYWLFITLLLYFIFQGYYFFAFVESPLYIAMLSLYFCVLYFFLSTYTLKTIYCPQPLLPIGLFLSRYSLPIYFIHLIILQIIYTLQTH